MRVSVRATIRVGVFCKGWCKVGARVRIVGGFYKGSCTGVVASSFSGIGI